MRRLKAPVLTHEEYVFHVRAPSLSAVFPAALGQKPLPATSRMAAPRMQRRSVDAPTRNL